MASCLGLYIENNLIKYAKVSKNNNDAIKVESFGIKFYDNLKKAINQVIEETYSFKDPISINVTEEAYNKFEVFSLLSKKDIDNVVKTEFENICYDKEINANAYEQKYIICNSNIQKEKVKIIHISVEKSNLAQKSNYFSEYRLNKILPMGVTIANLLKKDQKSTCLIVNLEKNTTITKVYGDIISDIEVIQIGSQSILEKISAKENSFAKAYEICKNTTIYTENDIDLQYEENEYLEDIMPTLFQIVSEVKKNTEESFEKIEKVYITGTVAMINNIDIYFQEYLKDISCEVLKPSFINANSKLNIKDYIEVNSAISLALFGLEKNNNINFAKENTTNKLLSMLKTDITPKSINEAGKGITAIVNKFESQNNIIFFISLLLLISYFVGSYMFKNYIDNKIDLTNASMETTNSRIEKINEYNTKFNNQITNYKNLIREIENANNANSEDKRYKNTIPNLLNNIMVVIPKSVQLTSIENTSDTHIVIKANSKNYEQIAYFKTKLKTEGILTNVVSDTGTMNDGNLSVTIEGELP